MNDENKLFFDEIIKILQKNNVDTSTVKLMNKSEDYITLVNLKEYDILRFKLTDRTKWVTIMIPYKDRKKEIDNSLFKDQKNKKQIYWKAKLNSYMDINKYEQFIINAYNEIQKQQ